MSATIQQYLTARLARYRVTLTDVEWEVLLADAGVQTDTPYDAVKAKQVLVQVLPDLLTTAKETEGGYSVEWNVAGIAALYNQLCQELGLVNRLTPKPTLTDKSSIW